MMFKPQTLMPLVAASLLLACSEHADNPVEARNDLSGTSLNEPRGPASKRLMYQVRLAAQDGFRSRGVMLIDIVEGKIIVRVHASGLMPNHHIPQHIHVNPTCNPGGGVLINLDANLTVPGEGPGVGTAYPLSNQAGVIKYRASRSLADLMSAVNTYQGTTLSSVEELMQWLNLEERNGHMHVAVGPPFPAVNCGEVERRK